VNPSADFVTDHEQAGMLFDSYDPLNANGGPSGLPPRLHVLARRGALLEPLQS